MRHEQAGTLGLIAYIAIIVGNVLFASLLFVSAYIVPGIEGTWVLGAVAVAAPAAMAAIPISMLILIVGLLLFAIANMRAGVLPRVAAWLMFAGMLLNMVSGVAGLPVIIGALAPIWLGVGLAWMGVALRSESRVPIRGSAATM